MSSLRDRLAAIGGEPAAAEVVRRLEAGERMESLGLAPADLIAALAFDALGGPESLGPALVQRPPRRPRLGQVLREESIARLLPGSSRPARLALAAALLQIHDFWDASHEAAQLADDLGEDRFSAYWHGIAHRREPDPGNASYWFRRVGRHGIFGKLARAARPILDAHGDARCTSRLIGQGDWDASAMIDLCTRTGAGTPEEALARKLQRLEMELLLDETARVAVPGLGS
jgi:hypothetical protein